MLTAYRPFKRRPALESSDVVTSSFNRLGNLGVLLTAGALLLVGLAGAAGVHLRLAQARPKAAPPANRLGTYFDPEAPFCRLAVIRTRVLDILLSKLYCAPT